MIIGGRTFNWYVKPSLYGAPNMSIDSVLREFSYKFMFLPEKHATMNEDYTTIKKTWKWLVWAYIEKRTSSTGYSLYWTTSEKFLMHYDISLDVSRTLIKNYWPDPPKKPRGKYGAPKKAV